MKNNPLDHYGLILKVLRRYENTAAYFSNVDREDLIQEGWVAIIRKIDGHNPDKGSISTYLMLWVVDAMNQYIRHRSVMRKSMCSKTPLAKAINESSEYFEYNYPQQVSPEDVVIGMESARVVVDEYINRVRVHKNYARDRANAKLQMAIGVSNLTNKQLLEVIPI